MVQLRRTLSQSASYTYSPPKSPAIDPQRSLLQDKNLLKFSLLVKRQSIIPYVNDWDSWLPAPVVQVLGGQL